MGGSRPRSWLGTEQAGTSEAAVASDGKDNGGAGLGTVLRRTAAAVLVLVLTFGLLLAGERGARACSCAMQPAADVLADPGIPAAMVGTVIHGPIAPPIADPDEPRSSDQPVRWVIRVDAVLVDELPETIVVVSSSSGASCGLETRVGDRLGLVLRRTGPPAASDLCSQYSADEMLRAGEGRPPRAPTPEEQRVVAETLGQQLPPPREAEGELLKASDEGGLPVALVAVLVGIVAVPVAMAAFALRRRAR